MKSIYITLFSVIFIVSYAQGLPTNLKGFQIPRKSFFVDPKDIIGDLNKGQSTPKYPTLNLNPEIPPASETDGVEKSMEGNSVLNQSDLQKNIKPFASSLPTNIGSQKKEDKTDTNIPDTNLSPDTPVIVNSDETKMLVDEKNQGASTVKAVQENHKQEISSPKSSDIPALRDATSPTIEEDMQQSASEDSYQNAKPLNNEGQSLLPSGLISNEEGKVNPTDDVSINTFLQPPSKEASNTYNQEEELQKKIS